MDESLFILPSLQNRTAVVSYAYYDGIYWPNLCDEFTETVGRFIQGFMYVWMLTQNGWQLITSYRPSSRYGKKSLGEFIAKLPTPIRLRLRLPSTYG